MATEKQKQQFASLDRRGFLRATAAGAGLLTAAASLPACSPDIPPLPKHAGSKWLFMDPLTHAVLGAAADALVHGTHTRDGSLPYPSQTAMLEHLDRMVHGLSEDMQSQIRLLARAMEFGSMIFGMTFTRFSKLPLQERQAILADWCESRIALRRVAGNGLKMLTMAFYWTENGTFAHMHYDGPLLERADIPYFEINPMLEADSDSLPVLPQKDL